MNHTEHLYGLRISYWRREAGGVLACDKTDAMRANVSPIGKHYPEFTFDLPGQKNDLEKLLVLAATCERVGDYKARAEIRAALGVS